MTVTQKLQKRAVAILKLMEDENISSCTVNPEITKVRKVIYQQPADFKAPGLTRCIATTYCGVGLCQELSQRFVFEYTKKYRDQAVSLIILSNPGRHLPEDYMLVMIGAVNAPDRLIIGRGDQNVEIGLNY